MTIIAAMYETPDALLIGADSAVTVSDGSDEIRAVPVRKLRRHRAAPLAWAYTGFAQSGEDLTRWLIDVPWPPPSLDAFITDVQGHLADLNRVQRNVIRRAGARPRDVDVTEVVITVFLKQPLIFALGARGNATRYTTGELLVTGSGAREAMLARHTLHAIGYKPPSALFGAALHIAAVYGRQCALPIDIWRVTEAGVEEIVTQGRRLDRNDPLSP